MQYLVVEKSTQEFKKAKSIKEITQTFEGLETKKDTIGNRFRELAKKGENLVINEWGFKIYRF